MTISTGDSGVTRHVYDAVGQRVLRVDPDGVKTLYLGSTELQWSPTSSWSTSVQVTRHYPGGTHRGFDGSLTYTVAGHQGSVIASVNATTGAVTHNRYLPYGELRAGATVNDKGFLNQTHDDATNLVYLNNRHHDPTLGQFISVDPLVIQTGEAYIYGAANPIAYSDPSGLCTVSKSFCDANDADYNPAGGSGGSSGGGGSGSGGGSSHGPIGELTPNFNLNSGVPVCDFPTYGSGPCIPGQDAIDEGLLVPLVPRDIGPGGFYEVFGLSGETRHVIDVQTHGYSWVDAFFEGNQDWLPAGLVVYSKSRVFLVNDAMISVAAFDRGDGSLLDGRSGSTVMDVLVVINTSTFAPYWNRGPDGQPGADPTNSGNVLGMFGDPQFAGATLYPIGSTSNWIPASVPVASTPVWLNFDPLREYLR